jgi:hypothetical protein
MRFVDFMPEVARLILGSNARLSDTLTDTH